MDFLVDFLIDSLMCLCISFTALKILTFSTSRLILINSQKAFLLLSLVFLILGQYFYPYDPLHQLLLQVYSHENKDQFYSLKHFIEFAYLLLQIHTLLILILIVLWSTFCHVL